MNENKPKIDLYSDYCNIFATYLSDNGIRLKHPDDACLDYLIYTRRHIPPNKRNIVKSKYFVCPQEYSSELQYIEERIRNGEDLTPFLSRGIEDCSRDDLMLYDWGIYHLHLSADMDPTTGFVKRSSQLLYAIFIFDTAFFIKTVPHQGLTNMWSMQECLEEVYEQWLFLLEPFKINGIVEPVLSDEDISHLRSIHMNPVITLKDGSCICSPGSGFASDGTPFREVMYRVRMYRMLKCAEYYLSDNMNKIMKQINLSFSEKVSISLKYIDGEYNCIVINFNKAIVILDINDYNTYGKFISDIIIG